MPAERPVCDAAVRERLARDLETTFLVEASAGTGKTRVLVDRYVSCVLDPRREGDVRRVAAITFTEKAAAELRQRVRERFERMIAGLEGELEPRATATVARALEQLEQAPIGTIHCFAGRLLREFCVVAAVDPAFEQLDPLAAEIERGRLWEQWLSTLVSADAASAGAEPGGFAAPGGAEPGAGAVATWLRQLLDAGVRLETVRALAVEPGGLFDERYDLDPVPPPPARPDLSAGIAVLTRSAAEFAAFCTDACCSEVDKGLAIARELIALARACAADAGVCRAPGDEVRLLRAVAQAASPTNKGNKNNWDAALGGKERFIDDYTAIVAEAQALLDEYAIWLTNVAAAVADSFVRWAASELQRSGKLDFSDLLGQLRELLVRDLEARRELQQRFDAILVDEFQDTDPLQAECVLFLCESEPRAAVWRDVALQPGKLFVVGDPKQSIYRFRRADIALYDEVTKLIAGQADGSGAVLAIEQNFRTTPTLVEWVNEAFAEVFDSDAAEGRQPRYQRVAPFRPPADEPSLTILVADEEEGDGGRRPGADAAHRGEARALAALLREMQAGGEASTVAERAAAVGDRELRRPLAWGDIAVLVKATTHLEKYESAFRDAGVPYRIEGGKTYFRRSEVEDALLCLRAIDDPLDGPALYGALHSSLFGFSDDELFHFWAAGGVFDVFAAQRLAGAPDGVDPPAAVAAALATLRDLHRQRFDLAPDLLLTELLRVTFAHEVLAATAPGAAQALANLDQLVDRAKAFVAAGGGGLTAFLDWAADAGGGAGERESLADDEGDAVHVLTIHGAKGLEYPVVVLAGGASLSGHGSGDRPVRLQIDRVNRRAAIALDVAELGKGKLDTPAWRELHERDKEMDRSEQRRLLYVAATRARDRLIIGVHSPLVSKGKGTPTTALLAPLADRLPAPGAVTERLAEGARLAVPWSAVTAEAPLRGAARPATAAAPAGVDALLEKRAAWCETRAAQLAQAAQPLPATSPSALERLDESPVAEYVVARSTALALGSAVHRVMELCDLNDAASLPALAESAAREFGHAEIASLVLERAQTCWAAATLRRAAASPELYRELPIAAMLDGVIVSGAIDLLFRNPDAAVVTGTAGRPSSTDPDAGTWTIVDYKTDRDADPDTLRNRYAPQAAAYARAVEAATGGVVDEIILVAAATGTEVPIACKNSARSC